MYKCKPNCKNSKKYNVHVGRKTSHQPKMLCQINRSTNKEMNDRFLVQHFQKHTGYAQSNGKMTLNSELHKMWKQVAVAHFKALTHYLP